MNLLTCFSLSRMTHDQIVWTTAAEHAPALEKVYTTGLKRILGVAPGTHNRASRELMGATSLEIIRHKALLMHAKHVHDMPDDRLTKKVWEIAAADTILGPGYLQSTPKFAAQLLAKWRIQEKLPLSKGIFKRATKTAAFTAEAEQFSDRNTASKLCYLKGYAPLKGNMAPCVKARIPKGLAAGRDISIRHLLGTNDLEMDRGRYGGTAPAARLCKCCDSGIPEDALHCDLECADPARQRLVTRLRENLAKHGDNVLANGDLVSEMTNPDLLEYLQDPQRTGPLVWEWYRHLIRVRNTRSSSLGRQGPRARPLPRRQVQRGMNRVHQNSALSPRRPQRQHVPPARFQGAMLHAAHLDPVHDAINNGTAY